jgi:multicomponent Na+:H+ antiporter subunit A
MDRSLTILALVAVFAPVVMSLATLLLPRSAITTRTIAAILAAIVSVGAIVGVMVLGGYGTIVSIPFVPALNISFAFHFDQLGCFFALLVAGMGILINTYARGYFGRDGDQLFRFYPTNGFFMTAMVGVVLSNNLLCLLIFWEMTAISSFLLIGWERDDKVAVRLAMQAFITTGLGGLALMAGLILLGIATDVWSLSEVTTMDLSDHPRQGLIAAAFIAMFLGAAAKSAQWPFHYWLPGAMAAPTPVSAYLHSATMVKAGVYLFARLYPAFRHIEIWPYLLIIVGTLTMVIGAYLALRNYDLKKIFAYTTVSQLALFTTAYGLGAFDYDPGAHGHGASHAAVVASDHAILPASFEPPGHEAETPPGHDSGAQYAAEAGHASNVEHAETGPIPNVIWPVVQIMNHALYKAPLFILAGAIGHIAGSRDIRRLGNLIRRHRLLASLTLIAAYAMAAGPGTLSFDAKEAFLYQIYHAAEQRPLLWIVGVGAVIMAMANVAIFVRLLTTFVGLKGSMAEDLPPEDDGHHHHEHEHGFWGSCIWWPAAFLLFFQVIGGLFAGWFGDLVAGIETHVLYWDHLPWPWEIHLSPPLGLSVVAIILGGGLGLSAMLRTFQDDIHNRIYPGFYWLAVTGGGRAFRTVQTGNFRVYVVFMLVAAIAGLIGVTSLEPDLLKWRPVDLMEHWPGVLITIVICVTTLLLPIVQQRVVRVLILGSVGFSVTAMYLIYQAPDLALTQLMFEIISVILFLLVLRMLPEYNPKPKNLGLVTGRVLVSALIGLSIGWLTYVAASTQLPEGLTTLGDYFLANSYEATTPGTTHGGGGNNVVNVILVDFRGFDTLGEITVLGIAAIGVWSLMSRREVDHIDFKPIYGAQEMPGNGGPAMSSIIFRTSQRILLALSLIFAVYVFMKGHQEPGGGFIAGLIAAVALAIYRMAAGSKALMNAMPIKPEKLVALGLTFALLTGLGALVLGSPFFTSDHGYLGSGVNQVEWASVMLFDFGVFLVVTGVSVGMIARLSEEIE